MLTTLTMEWIETAKLFFRKTNCFESLGKFRKECTRWSDVRVKMYAIELYWKGNPQAIFPKFQSSHLDKTPKNGCWNVQVIIFE